MRRILALLGLLPGIALAQPAPPSGAMVLLGTVVASGQANIGFTGFASTWTQMQLVCTHMMGSVGGTNFVMQIGTGTPATYLTTGYQNAMITNGTSSTTVTGYGNTADAGMGVPGTIAWSSSGSGDMMYSARIEQPSAAIFKVARIEQSGFQTGDGTFQNIQGTSTNTTSNAAWTGFRVLFSSGNIATGQCSLYGIAS